jgi:hypothetical protein
VHRTSELPLHLSDSNELTLYLQAEPACRSVRSRLMHNYIQTMTEIWVGNKLSGCVVADLTENVEIREQAMMTGDEVRSVEHETRLTITEIRRDLSI